MVEFNVVAFVGSLRRDSVNAKALKAAVEVAPASMRVEFLGIEAIPLYNDDLRGPAQDRLPEPVAAIRKAIADADGLLIASPEYNYGPSGVTKNAIDWISTGANAPLQGKPVALMSASPGGLGGSRGLYQLRQNLIGLNARVMGPPEIMIAGAYARFDEAGALTDAPTREILTKFMAAFEAWIRINGAKG